MHIGVNMLFNIYIKNGASKVAQQVKVSSLTVWASTCYAHGGWRDLALQTVLQLPTCVLCILTHLPPHPHTIMNTQQIRKRNCSKITRVLGRYLILQDIEHLPSFFYSWLMILESSVLRKPLLIIHFTEWQKYA